MEPVRAVSDGEWDSYIRNLCSEEHHLSQCKERLSASTPLPELNTSFSLHNENLLHSLNASGFNMQYNPLEGSQQCSNFSTRAFPSTSNQEACYISSSNSFPLVNAVKDTDTFFPASTVNEGPSNRRSEKLSSVPSAKGHFRDEVNTITSSKSKKKSRVSKDVQNGHKNVQYSKLNEQSSSSYSSEDETASMEANGASDRKAFPALNLNGTTRASRGSATDPQSVYARKRRERINERLRTLQNLIPNGTKVDISTMLEEAVNYVKFLQLQIKLLSSNDLWMYAPLAFNGIDIGLDKKLSEFL